MARDLAIATDRTRLVTTVTYSGPKERLLDITLDAERLSLPEVGRYFRPLANIRLEPAVDVTARGTLDALNMDVNVVSSAGSARGPLVGHFGDGSKSLEGRLDVRDVNMAPILNREVWKTRVTGQADFDWAFSPAEINFKFAGPHVEGLGYQAANVRAKGVYQPALLRFDASGAGYGAAANTRATFRFATPAHVRCLTRSKVLSAISICVDCPSASRCPGSRHRLRATTSSSRAGGTGAGAPSLTTSTVEGARFEPGTLLGIESRDRQLTYSASGNVSWLNPRYFAAPLDVQWLDDERLGGSLSGTFTFEGSGRTVDDLVLQTRATLVDSTLAGARFPRADVDFRMENRQIRAKFTGAFEELPGTLFTERKELADTTLNGSADMAVALAVPKAGSTELARGDRHDNPCAVDDCGHRDRFGPGNGVFRQSNSRHQRARAHGHRHTRDCRRHICVWRDRRVEARVRCGRHQCRTACEAVQQAVDGAAHLVGQATGPASNLTIAGAFGANRLRYGTNLEALTVNSKYTIQLPGFDIEQARLQADSGATFMSIAGTNLPRVTAKAVYEKKQLDFDAMVEEERRSLALGGNVVFHPDHDELHLRALDFKVGQTQWAMPTGQEATARYSDNSVTLDNFILQRGEQRLTAAGTVAVGAGSANLTNDFNVRLDNVQVQDVNELLLGNRSLAGVLNATARDRRYAQRSECAVGFRDHRRNGGKRELQFPCGQGHVLRPRRRRGRSPRTESGGRADGRRHHPRAQGARQRHENRGNRSGGEELAHRHRAAAAGNDPVDKVERPVQR